MVAFLLPNIPSALLNTSIYDIFMVWSVGHRPVVKIFEQGVKSLNRMTLTCFHNLYLLSHICRGASGVKS